jgi:hypothetical protein
MYYFSGILWDFEEESDKGTQEVITTDCGQSQ